MISASNSTDATMPPPPSPILGRNRRVTDDLSALQAALVEAEADYTTHPLTDGGSFNEDELTVGRTTCRVTDTGLDRLCKQIAAPAAYLRKLPTASRSDLFSII